MINPPKPKRPRMRPLKPIVPDEPIPPFSPDLSELDRVGALMTFGNWPTVGEELATAEVLSQVRSISFDQIGAASIFALERKLDADLRTQGIDPTNMRQVIKKANDEYASATA